VTVITESSEIRTINTVSCEFLWIRRPCECLLLELGLDLVSGWLVVMHTYSYYFLLSLSRSLINIKKNKPYRYCTIFSADSTVV